MKNFKAWLKSSTLVEKKDEYNLARDAYYNATAARLTDDEYDQLEEAIREVAPNWSGLKKTGSVVKIGKKQEVQLPVPCPSLDKVVAEKPEMVLGWIKKAAAKYGTYFRLSEKLDGSSLEGRYLKGKLSLLATRGDGTTGKDITFLAPYLNIPKEVDFKDEMVVRFEAIMPIKAYNERWAGQYDTARALASAVLNRQDAAPALKDLKIVALRVLKPLWSLDQGLEFLQNDGFDIAAGSVVTATELADRGIEKLVKTVNYFKGNSPYETDGAVLCSNAPNLKTTGDRPEYARAFKVNDSASALLTTIVEIKWQASSFGVLVPKAIIAPLKIGGATIKQAAIYNARWAIDRGVGVGAIVKVLRSGDIIPKIVEVVKPQKFLLPNRKKHGSYSWDKTKTSLVLDEAGENAEVLSRRFSRFFAKLGLENMAIGIGVKLAEAGYTETSQVVQMIEQDFRDLGIKSRAPEFANSMKEVLLGGCDQVTLMAASGCFDRGLGSTRLRTLEAAGRKYFTREAMEFDDLDVIIAGIPGCGKVFGELYAKGLPRWWEWVDATGVTWKKPPAKAKAIEGPLTGQSVSWTGYRSHEEEETVKSLGGQVVNFSLTKTTILLYAVDGIASTKVEKAQKKGIKTALFSALMKAIKR